MNKEEREEKRDIEATCVNCGDVFDDIGLCLTCGDMEALQ